MKKFIISLLLFLMLCSTASAFEDSVERYPNGVITDYWTLAKVGNGANPVISEFPSTSGYHSIYFSSSATTSTGSSSVVSKTYIDTTYISFTVKEFSTNGNSGAYWSGIVLDLTNSTEGYSHNYVLYQVYPVGTVTLTNTTFEIIRTSGRYYLYRNGEFISDLGAAAAYPNLQVGIRTLSVGATGHAVSHYAYIDDISNEGSTIGIKEEINELSPNFLYSHRIQAYSSYPSSVFTANLYSLTADNAGLISSQTLTSQSGNDAFSRSLAGNNYGIYMIELSRDDDVLRDTYFYYYQTAYPQSLPEVLFKGDSSVITDIRDEDNNGGEVQSGESVYLYPDINANGEYTFSYSISETPYAISTGLSTVYNTTAINALTLNYNGLSSQNYNVNIDGAVSGQTNGADTYSHTFSGTGITTNHIISFSPDYSKAGVWGEVKNSETQTGIKSATVSVSGENFSKTIYTDENGLYYLTKGMEAGKTYSITVSKTGYTTPPSQTAVTTDGSTTRQDFYMDKTSTDGSGLYYAPHDVGFTVLEYWYSGAGLTGVNYAIYNGTESLKTGSTDSKGMFTGSDMKGGTNYTITLTYNGKTYTEYVEPSLTEYVFVLNKEGILHQYVNSWLSLNYTENSQNVTIAYESNKTLSGASLTVIAGNGTTVYTQTLSTATGSFTFETGGEGDYTLNFHIEATDGSTASQSWGLSYPDGIPLFPDSYPAWLKNVLFSGIVMVFLLAFGKSKNDVACGAVAILTSMGYMFGWFTGSFYFVAIVWLIAIGAAFLHYKRTGGIG